MPSRDIYYFMPGISVDLNIEIKDSKNKSVLDILQVKTSNYSFNVSVSKYHKILYEIEKLLRLVVLMLVQSYQYLY